MDRPLILDTHLDLSMNAMEWNRDLRWSVEDIRLSEMGMDDKPDRAKNTVSLPALREGNIGIIVATQIARYVKQGSSIPGWNSQETVVIIIINDLINLGPPMVVFCERCRAFGVTPSSRLGDDSHLDLSGAFHQTCC